MSRRLLSLCLLVLAVFLIGCPPEPQPAPPPAPTSDATAPPEEEVPLGKLPDDVRPIHYDLALTIVPAEKRFQGKVSIQLELKKERRVVWLHGNGLDVSEASATPVAAVPVPGKYSQAHDDGVAKVVLDQPVGPGDVTLDLTFEGPFDERLNGLYRVEVSGEHYAFTQMEPVWTRKAFPCFDEPKFKTPFDITLTGPASGAVITNTKEVSREDAGEGLTRVRFAKTEPLPTYLIAFAVGPLDVVEAPAIPANEARKQPLPFRGIAAKGRGQELAYALANTPPLLEELERYFGVAYPYDKLDIIAVPDKGGAMENAGLVTFREWLLLLDETAPIRQRQAFSYVMAHELAHQWFGNLVTMPWWDDIWLNEAFATWMGYRVVEQVTPSFEADMRALSGVHGAMDVDSLLSARQIRQPVMRNEHIHAAFDRITYRKGGGVLSMLERWLGPEVFRKGMQRYMRKHAHGSAAADDLMQVLTATAGKDVGTPFRTFLMQPGLPNVHAELSCEGAPKLKLSQSRFLPYGTKQAETGKGWQIPVCVRYGSGKKSQQTCTLLASADTSVALEGGCPKWVMPNAGAAGYYAWSMPSEMLEALTTHGLRTLDTREQVSVGRAVLDMMRAGRIDATQAEKALMPLARMPHPDVVRAPMQFIGRVRYYLEGDPLAEKAEALGRSWFRHTYAKLGWKAQKREKQSSRLLRTAVIGFLLHTGRDAELRKQANLLARQYLQLDKPEAEGVDATAMDANIVGTVLAAASEDADAAFFDAALAKLKKTNDEETRSNLITALTHVRDPALAERARKLTLDPVLKVNESMRPLWGQMSEPSTREATWTWVKDEVDAVFGRLARRQAGWLPSIATRFCSEERADEMKSFFEPRLPKMPGGRREIDKAHESMVLCSMRKAFHLPKVRELLSK